MTAQKRNRERPLSKSHAPPHKPTQGHHATISLIGMPGAGKSTVGVVLAKQMGLAFTDTDLAIQVRENATLEQILQRQGHQRLRAIEEEVLLSLSIEAAVISTGGSVVYSRPAMERLRRAGPVVYLKADLATLERRVAAAPPRGIASPAGQSFAELYAERTPLYESQADLTVDASSGPADAVAMGVIAGLATIR